MSDPTQFGALVERTVVLRARAGDRHAFHELVRRYERRLLYYLRRMVDETEALDALQDVWLTVFRKIGSLQAPEAFRVWLYKIAHDVAVSHLQRQRRWPQSVDDEPMQSEAIDRWNEFEALENVELVHTALGQLSPLRREALTLRFLESLDLREMADVLGVELGTVKSRLHYAKLQLREQLGTVP